MLIPTHRAHWDAERSAAYIWFDDPMADANGWYHLRGGVSWPGTLSAKHSKFLSGAMVVLGLNMRTMTTHLFAVHEFQVVEPHLRASGGIAHPGLHEFTNQVWSRWYADTYYWHGDDETARKHLLECERSPMMLPKPMFSEALFDDAKSAILHAIQWANTGRLIFPIPQLAVEAANSGDASIADRLKLAGEHLDTPDPDIWALACAVSGLAAAPPDRLA